MKTPGDRSTDSEAPVKSDSFGLWIGLLSAAAIIVGALLHWGGPVPGTETNLRALWDPELVRDATLVRTVGFAMIVVGVVVALGAVIGSARLSAFAGLLAVAGVVLFAISIMRGSEKIADINIGPLICLLGGLAAISADALARRIGRPS